MTTEHLLLIKFIGSRGSVEVFIFKNYLIILSSTEKLCKLSEVLEKCDSNYSIEMIRIENFH